MDRLFFPFSSSLDLLQPLSLSQGIPFSFRFLLESLKKISKKNQKNPLEKTSPFYLILPPPHCAVCGRFSFIRHSPSTQVGQLASILFFHPAPTPFHSPCFGYQWALPRHKLTIDRAHRPAPIGASFQRAFCCAEARPCVWQKPHPLPFDSASLGLTTYPLVPDLVPRPKRPHGLWCHVVESASLISLRASILTSPC